MARRKLTPIFTPNTLAFMIEYTLISNILDKICEMINHDYNFELGLVLL
jgi:hypothetical protein